MIRINLSLNAVSGRRGVGPPAVEALKDRIIDEHPALGDEATSPWQRICLIRRWAWANIAVSDLPLTLPARSSNWLPMNSAQVFSIFQSGCGGVWCGGAALALRALYHDFGYDTALIELHLPQSLGPSHTVTAVCLPGGPSPLWFAQDAYFDLCHVDADGRGLHLTEVLNRLVSGRSDDVILASALDAPCARPVALVSEELHANRAVEEVARDWWCVDPDDYSCEVLADGRYRFESSRGYQRYAPLMAGFRAMLEELGLPPHDSFMYLCLDESLREEPACRRFFDRLAAILRSAAAM